MNNKSDEDVLNLHEVAAIALEAARAEVVNRLRQRNLPLSLQAEEMQIVGAGDGSTAWNSQRVTVQVSPLHQFDILRAIQDNSVDGSMLGLRPQLEPLAQLLDKTSDLGARTANTSVVMFPALSGVDAILARYITQLATTYLLGLQTLDTPDPVAVARLAGELDELIEPTFVRTTSQLAIEGVKTDAQLEYKDVRLRPLTPSERGRQWLSRSGDQLYRHLKSTDFVVPHEFTVITPSMLLEVTTTRNRSELFSQSTLLNRIALAFYLKGFDIASNGVAVSFDRPTWATYGQSHARALVDEKSIAAIKPVSQADFRQIVDLAYKMPDFGPGEASSHEIALYRALRGLGIHYLESGLLDLVIALEAALLQDFEQELSYRFALYGALFLQEERNPTETFNQLKNIYLIRSRLVHGGKIDAKKDAKKREQAIQDAPEIVKAVVLKAIEHGWPDHKQLDQTALTP